MARPGEQSNAEVSCPTKGSEEGGGDKSPFVAGWLDNLTEYINLHIRLYRLTPYIIGAVGIVYFLRYFRVPLKRLQHVSDIPKELIISNRKLTGVVKATGPDNIGVWHIPQWKRMLLFKTNPPKQCSSKDLLLVRFSGVAIENFSTTTAWLKSQTLGKRVWVRLLDSTSTDSVHCVVHMKQPGTLGRLGRKICVNNELLMLGMGTVEEVKGVSSNNLYAKLTTSFLKSEQVAKKKGVGVWQGTEYVSVWNKMKTFLEL